MVQKTTVTLIDDLDENITEDVQTVTFAHEGKTYEIDLGAENRQALDDALASYKAVARKAGRSTTSPSPGAPVSPPTPAQSASGLPPTASRSTTAAASPPTSANSSTPPRSSHRHLNCRPRCREDTKPRGTEGRGVH
ncbi:hypothetical protein GCM10025875_36940 [Litorihabitans aurantiacus]|uniref:Lsr2 dimerization domain-containing protein n=1 Tax=Litorihabitans aurantiacus TaxID=1930061 RepID=A0AA38CXR8_9MICO|nr:hypothetical protein GCM10025875_36840 [Litorihabitans aurantiacus]GMA33702.1 hypothetical protein GCM10025875_36940 [Litorihabitans aurantiacus]